jgi:hypothetical protein
VGHSAQRGRAKSDRHSAESRFRHGSGFRILRRRILASSRNLEGVLAVAERPGDPHVARRRCDSRVPLARLLDIEIRTPAVDHRRRDRGHSSSTALHYWLGLTANRCRCALTQHATLALPGLLLSERTRVSAVLTAAAASLVLNAQVGPMSAPDGWEGKMTCIPHPPKPDSYTDFIAEERIQQTMRSSRAKILVFPEGAVRHWTDATDAFWTQTLAGSGKRS